MCVFNPAVGVSEAEPLLGSPAIEGIATLPRYNRSNNDMHCGSLSAAFEHIGLLITFLSRADARYRSSVRSPEEHVSWLTRHAYFLEIGNCRGAATALRATSTGSTMTQLSPSFSQLNSLPLEYVDNDGLPFPIAAP
jgi:hypothetical protein